MDRSTFAMTLSSVSSSPYRFIWLKTAKTLKIIRNWLEFLHLQRFKLSSYYLEMNLFHLVQIFKESLKNISCLFGGGCICNLLEHFFIQTLMYKSECLLIFLLCSRVIFRFINSALHHFPNIIGTKQCIHPDTPIPIDFFGEHWNLECSCISVSHLFFTFSCL